MDRLEIIATLQKASNLVNTLNKTAVALTGGLRINSLARELEGYYKISRSKDGLIFYKYHLPPSKVGDDLYFGWRGAIFQEDILLADGQDDNGYISSVGQRGLVTRKTEYEFDFSPDSLMPIVWNIREYDKSKGRIATSDRFLVEDVAHLHHIQSKIASYSEWLTDLRAHPVNLSNSAVEELQPKLYEYTQLVGLKAVYKPYSFK